MQPSIQGTCVQQKGTISCCGNYRWDESFKVFFQEFFSMLSLRRGKSLKAEGSFQVSQNVAVLAFTMILVFGDHHLAVLQRSPTCHHVFSNVVGPPLKKHANMCTVQSEKIGFQHMVLIVCHQLKNKPWEPKTFIFRGYNPYIGGLKPSFFMVLGSKGSNFLLQITQMSWYFPFLSP